MSKMKQFPVALAMLLSHLSLSAQTAADNAFRAHLYNEEEDVYMDINFYEQDVIISGQEVFGKVAGYLARSGNSFCWIVTEAKLKGRKAELEMVNDYGSDDLKATLTQVDDSTYTLQQNNGAALKVPLNGKWHKLPHTLTLKRRK